MKDQGWTGTKNRPGCFGPLHVIINTAELCTPLIMYTNSY